MKVPVYAYKVKIGTDRVKERATFRDEVNGQPKRLIGHLVVPDDSLMRETKAVIQLLVPRPGLGRFVTFGPDDAIAAAQRGSFHMSWEPEIA